MVQINLLPPSAKKRQRLKLDFKALKTVDLKPLIFALVGTVVLVMVFWLALGIRLNLKQNELARLNEQAKLARLNSQKLDEISKEKEWFQKKLEFLDQRLKREISWAENLNHLSSLVPPGVWLSNIVVHSREEDAIAVYDKLNIDGSAVSLAGEEMIVLIGGFMRALKEDEVFSEQFSEIKLVSSQKKKRNNIDVMDFKLLCQFR